MGHTPNNPLRGIARNLSQAELEEIAEFWLTANAAAQTGDHEAKLLAEGTFGPWAAEIKQIRRT